MSNKKRINWIDTLRGIAMFFVVWGHCYPTNLGRIRKWIYTFHMPIFFFISGITYKEKNIEPKDYIKKKAKDLLLPYFIFNIICYFVKIIFNKVGIIEEFNYLENIAGIFYSNDEVFSMPCGPAWFIVTLFLVEIGFYLLKRVTKDDFQLTVSIVICGLISYVNSISSYQLYTPWHIDSAFTGIVFYYLGYLLTKNMSKLDELIDHKLIAFCTGGVLGLIGVVISIFNRRVSMYSNLYGSITMFYIGTISTIIGLVIFVRLFMNKSVVFKNIGKRTLFYLGYHLLLIYAIMYYFPWTIDGNIRKFILAIYVTIVIFPFAYFFDKFFPILCGKIKKKM